jgi:hypothetical protein
MPLIRTELVGTYVESTACSSKVILDVTGKPGHKFTTSDGKEVSFGPRKKVEYFWPGALVIPTGEVVEVQERGVESQFTNQTGDNDDMATLPGISKKAAGAVKSKKEKRAAKSKVADHPCLCGCGELCVGRFKMGHDGRFYKQLRQAIAGDVKFGALPGVIRSEVKDLNGAKAYLKNHGH